MIPSAGPRDLLEIWVSTPGEETSLIIALFSSPLGPLDHWAYHIPAQVQASDISTHSPCAGCLRCARLDFHSDFVRTCACRRTTSLRRLVGV